MTGSGRGSADLMREKKVHDMSVQEIWWKGNKAKELGDGYKLYHSGAKEEKGNFWKDMAGVMQELEEHERVIVGADLNGHVGSENAAIGQMHGGHGIGERNPEGESVVDLAVSYDMAIVNIFFKKKREHLLTYRSWEDALR
ncbi:uncharacterized protein LOC135226731 [Macrobrachium nipponense]|uniref:uncharacterized protein LOC135226731 n=1 Tax=Macrobrachium nipponense TaxID=159736 RepID=UPI0030C88F10